MITVWGRKSSSNVQAVMWCLLELDLPHKRIDAGLTYGVTKTPEYLLLNPNGTVPTIRDGDQSALWDSGAILRYLASTYADESFWPRDTYDRANVDMWAEWAKINIASNFTTAIFWQVVRTPAARRDVSVINEAVLLLERYLQIANNRLSQSTFLVSEKLTLADIQFAHILYRYFDIAIQRQDLPHLHRYYAMLTERLAYQSSVMVSYEELRDTL